MSAENKVWDTAQQISEILPALVHKVSADIRCLGGGLAPSQYHLLEALAEKPANLSELAGMLLVSLATMSKSIDTLVERGWARRSPSPHDRRMIQIEITPSGEQVLCLTRLQLARRAAELLESLSPAELSDLSTGLVILRRVLEQRINMGNVVNIQETTQEEK